MGARNQVGIGLVYRPARLHRLAEFIPWNRFLGSINVYKYGLRIPPIYSRSCKVKTSFGYIPFIEQIKRNVVIIFI